MMTPRHSRFPSGRRAAIRCAVLLLFAAILNGLGCERNGPSADSLQSARIALAEHEFALAEQLALRSAESQPDNSDAWKLAARAALKSGAMNRAANHLAKIPDSDDPTGAVRLQEIDLLLFELHQLTAAEAMIKSLRQRLPDSLELQERLGYLFGLTGRSWEAEEPRLKLLAAGREPAVMLWLLCLGDDAIENVESLPPVPDDTDDPLLALAVGRFRMERESIARGAPLLERAAALAPELEETQVRLGRALIDSRSADEFGRWLADRPQNTWSHPGLWVLAGRWAQDARQSRAAARCYWEALRRNPNLSHACYQLARLLEAEGRSENAGPFRERSQLLLEYLNAVKAARETFSPDSWQTAIALADQLALARETRGWVLLGRQHLGNVAVVRVWEERLKSSAVDASWQRVSDRDNPAHQLDLSDWPLPRWLETPVTPQSSLPVAAVPGRLRFENVAGPMGLDFRYFQSPVSAEHGPRMFEFTGGGVAVLDFDLDGWPDTFLTQGCNWPLEQTTPPDVAQSRWIDQLYRNRRGERFEDVTTAAQASEFRYGQGVAVGDFNADGFPDLLVANVGRNTLLVNQGDGTFADVTDQAGVGGHSWSTSAAMADLNGDGLTDLYVANYLESADLYTRTCPDPPRTPRICLPQSFSGAQDECYFNQGDGTFAPVDLGDAQGKGLGVLVGRLSGESAPAVLVANDTQPNFLWHPLRTDSGPWRFEDRAFVAGVALSGDGRAQADMGIAAGDVDGNGLTDLYITKFYNEASTLYLQEAPGSFTDATAAAGLRENSLHRLGFGTQFLDADLDGWLDLLVTNGHIDNLEHRGEPFRQPPQLFRNVGKCRFVEVPPVDAGSFFEGHWRGRSLARLDWNRDGLPDAVISHLDDPAALLENHSTRAGKFLSLSLRGTTGDREAIGAIVRIKLPGRTIVAELTTGDGYQAANERILQIGVGPHDAVQVTVQWPSGGEQVFADVVTDSRWSAIEGRPALVRMSAE